MVSQLPFLVVALSFIALPSFVNGALFPTKSNVKHVDPEGFRQALKEEVGIANAHWFMCLTSSVSVPLLLHS